MASEYGWAKRDILNDVYLDELYELVVQINRRKMQEYKMQLAIAQNPHVKDPKKLWRILDESQPRTRKLEAKFDSAAFEIFKLELSKNPRFIVK